LRDFRLNPRIHSNLNDDHAHQEWRFTRLNFRCWLFSLDSYGADQFVGSMIGMHFQHRLVVFYLVSFDCRNSLKNEIQSYLILYYIRYNIEVNCGSRLFNRAYNKVI